MAVDLPEYLGNLRALLRTDVRRWGVVVERQILVQVLPKMAGSRAALERPLWDLLVLCLDGHEGVAPDYNDERWETARQAAADGRSLASDATAAFPRAAIGVAMSLAELREVGVYPAPRI